MKVIFICTKSITFNTFLKSQLDYFVKKGLKVKVACSDIDKLNIKNSLKYKIEFPKNVFEIFSIPRFFRILFQIRDLVKKNHSEIFYIHTPVASYLFRLFTFFDKLKIIYFVHGFRFTSLTNPTKSFFYKSIEKILSIKTDLYITINNEDYNFVKSNYFKKSFVYKINGVGLDSVNNNKKFFIKKKQIKKILVIAAYKKEKGYFELLKVADDLKDQSIKIDCYGYGDNYKFRNLKDKKKLKNIKFNKFDKNLKNKIKNYDILLHLSKREGLPVALMQCLSQGLPVICYNIRGNNDLVKNGFNGFFISTYKDVRKKISYLNLESNLINNLRLNAIKTINKDYFKKRINSHIYKIVKNYSKKY